MGKKKTVKTLNALLLSRQPYMEPCNLPVISKFKSTVFLRVIFIIISVCVCVCICVFILLNPGALEGQRSPEARVANGCQPPDVGAETRIRIF